MSSQSLSKDKTSTNTKFHYNNDEVILLLLQHCLKTHTQKFSYSLPSLAKEYRAYCDSNIPFPMCQSVLANNSSTK